MAYPHKWSPVSYRSSAGRRKNAGQRLTFYRWATQAAATTEVCCMQRVAVSQSALESQPNRNSLIITGMFDNIHNNKYFVCYYYIQAPQTQLFVKQTTPTKCHFLAADLRENTWVDGVVTAIPSEKNCRIFLFWGHHKNLHFEPCFSGCLVIG